MPTRKDIPLSKLLLNPRNPRIVECNTQDECLKQIYECGKNSFETLLSSILKNGFLQGENILVTPIPDSPGKYYVEEGNRRIAALKILHNIKSVCGKDKEIIRLLALSNKFSPEYKAASKRVPCIVFQEYEYKELLNEISIRHMSNAAARDDWPSLRKARFAKLHLDKSTPELELLEKFLYLNPDLDRQWSPVYPLTYLSEFIRPLSKFLRYQDAWEMTKAYPDPATQDIIDKLLKDIKRAVVDRDETGVEGITKLENRRSEAESFLSIHYKRPTIALNVQEKNILPVGESKEIGEKKEVKSISKSDDKQSSKQKAINPSKEKAKRVMELSKAIPNDKLQTLAAENMKLVLSALNIPFCKTLVLRTLFDVSAQCLCSAKGDQPKGKNVTLGGYVNHIIEKKLLQDDILTLLTEVRNKSIKSLNTFIHSQDITPAVSDLESNYQNVLPIIEKILETTKACKSAS